MAPLEDKAFSKVELRPIPNVFIASPCPREIPSGKVGRGEVEFIRTISVPQRSVVWFGLNILISTAVLRFEAFAAGDHDVELRSSNRPPS